MPVSLEQLIAYHCAPALAGIKASNIVGCFRSRIPTAKQDIRMLNRKLNGKGIFIETLCECSERLLLIVYREDKLTAQLRDPGVSEFLRGYGYDPDGSLQDYLDRLRSRLTNEEFPHEIGAFLGYPLHDILGFLHREEQECLLVGDWKVYEDAESARRLFCRFRQCRNSTFRLVCSGRHLYDMFRAA